MIKATLERKEDIITLSELPKEFISKYLEGFITLFSTGINCESALLVFMLKDYNNNPIQTNDKYFREQFNSFSEKNGGKTYADSTIKKSLTNLTNLGLLQKPEYKQYRIHKKFFIYTDEHS